MIWDDEIKTVWLLPSLLLLAVVEKPQRISGRRQTQTWDMCQLRCSSTQRRPNHHKLPTQICVLSLTTGTEAEGSFLFGCGGGADGRAKLGGCLFYNLASTLRTRNKDVRFCSLVPAVHTAFGLGLLKSPVMTDVNQSRQIIQTATTRRQQAPPWAPLSQTHTYTLYIYVCMTLWATLYDCHWVSNCSDHKEIPFKKLLFQTRSLIKECMILQWQDCIINSLQTVEFGCVTLKNVQNWRPVIKALREIPTH